MPCSFSNDTSLLPGVSCGGTAERTSGEAACADGGHWAPGGWPSRAPRLRSIRLGAQCQHCRPAEAGIWPDGSSARSSSISHSRRTYVCLECAAVREAVMSGDGDAVRSRLDQQFPSFLQRHRHVLLLIRVQQFLDLLATQSGLSCNHERHALTLGTKAPTMCLSHSSSWPRAFKSFEMRWVMPVLHTTAPSM